MSIQVELQEVMGSDRSVAEAAWTSSLDYERKQKRTDEEVTKVVKMLADNRHSTPFESVVLRFWIKMPIQTDRQHMTHRIGSHNGMSGRYRTMPNEFLDVPVDVNDITARIMSDVGVGDVLSEYYSRCEQMNNYFQEINLGAKEAEKMGTITNKEYKRFREFFRGMLPQNNMTERVTIFNLRSFANYQKLRNSEHAQPEIQLVAQLMLDEVKRKGVAPVAIKWLEENNWNI